MIDWSAVLPQAASYAGQGGGQPSYFFTDPSGTVRPGTAPGDTMAQAIARRVAALFFSPQSQTAYMPRPRPVFVPGSASADMTRLFPQDVPASPSGVLNPSSSLDPGGSFVRATPVAQLAAIARRQRESATRPRRINRGISLAELHRGLGLNALHPGIDTVGLHPGIGLRELHRGRGLIPRGVIGL